MEFKQVVIESGVDLVPRKGTLATLSILGFTKRNAEEILLSLSVTDYCKGPEADRDRHGEVWIFGKEIESHEVYIKLKVAHIKGTKRAKCISFHITEYPLSFPYK